MKIINVNQVDMREVSMDPLFFGGKVTIQSILEEAHKGEKVQVMMVNFAPGARNKLHTHITEQILIVTEGKGIVVTKNEENIVAPGMIAISGRMKSIGMAQQTTQFSLIYQYWLNLTNSKNRNAKILLVATF